MSEDILKTEILRIEKDKGWKLLSILGGFSELRVSTLEGIFLRITNADLFHDKDASICSATLSPDAKYIAFFMYIKHGNASDISDMGLFTIDISGKNLTRVNSQIFPFCFSHSNYGGGLCWSPDSKSIAFIGKEGKATYAKRELDSFFTRTSGVSPQDIYIVDIKSRRVSLVTENNVRNIYSQAWSKDNRELLYVNTNGEIIIHNVESNYPRKLENGDFPSWSRDGSWIIFREGQAAEGRYDVTSPLGAEKKLLCAYKAKLFESTLVPIRDLITSHPLWSPDNKYLLVSSLDTRINRATHYLVDFISRKTFKFENDMVYVAWEGA